MNTKINTLALGLLCLTCLMGVGSPLPVLDADVRDNALPAISSTGTADLQEEPQEKVATVQKESCEILETLCLEKIDDKPWGVALEIVIFAYCFLGLAIVCDAHLMVALETLCLRWWIREDVAGATFLAFGSAAPEIIINSVSTVNSASGTALGISAIIGSGMIAFTVIPAVSALFAPDTLQLKRRPLLRDVGFYSVGLVLLVIFFGDGMIQLHEAVTLVCCYALYVLVVAVSPSVREWYQQYRDPARKPATQTSFVKENVSTNALAASLGAAPLLPTTSSDKLVPTPDGHLVRSADGSVVADIRTDVKTQAGTESKVEATESKNFVGRAVDVLSAPYDLLFYCTMPNVHHGTVLEWLYPLTLLVALAYVAVLSFIISTIATRWSSLMAMPGAAFGLYMISIGAEVPDTIQSVAAAKRGYGNMATSNCIGSQICNIFVGLGLPWLLYNCIKNKSVPVDTSKHVRVPEHDTLRIAAMFQFSVVAIFALLILGPVAVLSQPKALLSRTKSYVLLGVYVAVLCGIGVIIVRHTA